MEPPKQELQIDQRLGVDGTEATDTGRRGQKFSLQSQVDCDDYNDAVTTFDSYRDLITSDPVIVIQGGVSSNDRGFKCQVLGVKLVHAATIIGIGGSGGNGWLECSWELIAIAT